MNQKPLHTQQDRGEQIQFALRLSDRKLVHISEVPNGIACDCVCPSLKCQCPLIAVNNEGIKVTPHFRHHSVHGFESRPCANALGIKETVTHLKAKEWIQRHKRIVLPYVNITKEPDADGCEYGSLNIGTSREISLDRVDLELRAAVDGDAEAVFIPDCTGYVGGRRVFIEVFVNHKVDDLKREKIRSRGIDTIEIIFDKGLVDPSDEDLEKVILNPIQCRWIFCELAESSGVRAKAEQHFNGIRQRFESERDERRLANRRARRQVFIELEAKRRMEMALRSGDPERRLKEHYLKISLEKRLGELQFMLAELEKDMYPNGIERSFLATPMDKSFLSSIKAAKDYIQRKNKELYEQQMKARHTLSRYLKTVEDETPPAENDRWASSDEAS